MKITDEEKTLLFEEFKARLEAEKKGFGYASGYATLHNMERAKDYFWDKYHTMTKEFEFDNWSQKGMFSEDWNLIRKLVCHAYGVSIVKHIPADKLEEANNLAIKMIDMLFERNHEILRDES